MGIDFHDPSVTFSYASRMVSDEWITIIKPYIVSSEWNAVDIGCGGGIYTKALLEMGASHVTALDFSESMLTAAKENCLAYNSRISFKQGEASCTHLPSSVADIVLERAVIHHLNDLESPFEEAFRLLKPGGIFIVQDRTLEDCLLPGSREHIRGYFFEKEPLLIEQEIKRRFSSERVQSALTEAGFTGLNEIKLWETRKSFSTFQELASDLKSRTGRSILFELNDEQLNALVAFIEDKLKNEKSINERDRWTIWFAVRP
ncbi:Ubiquinone/menaquinone biosynthesis C-methylase UbiE [Fictibacillus solisalsi]|uniref:Ubiquinone/menaquinone biosynthesis C-methylase UbiE n=1 Tax=Fictibacillus solisalsi TaxID=459525 RepID=A0A1G9XKC4_9BACL|nr:class I SAM-dependent methyltransferase [Fictibacillus solisalsi]SDM97282.1 Ubiquinone/menaquinone biosynthesis C-methylase UbiE [Fictibacillus solisalsi]